MEFGYNTRLKGTRVEKERGKFGSILREDDHFKRPPASLDAPRLTFLCSV